ncbi:site-specific integrase [Cardiobacteriaceae bacterium TAE3-ERU3]|nr:site-specific integrase [Cardiobacteriaceae bacterium TAE3-ERU3]
MSGIRERHGKLIVDFRYLNKRCRETTNLADTPANRKKLAAILEKMDAELLLGTFNYERYFPKSQKIKEFETIRNRKEAATSKTPTFAAFASLWFSEMEIEWKFSYQEKITQILDKYLLPAFGTQDVSTIQRQDLFAFRTSLAKVRYGSTNKSLSKSRINQIMTSLGMILREAAERYHFECPYKEIKSLEVVPEDIHPFSLDEVMLLINNVRKDYRDYFIVRFFTGMRTGEIDGLKRKYVDLDKRLIMIRESKVRGKMGRTKTKGSRRDIVMSNMVHAALTRQMKATEGKSEFVFCAENGSPLDYHNVNKRVWAPLLRSLRMDYRRPYQTRHTAATLWLAAGENPEWIARQMGHATTVMLFTVYSRFVPNLVRKDGSALEALITKNLTQNTSTWHEDSTVEKSELEELFV